MRDRAGDLVGPRGGASGTRERVRAWGAVGERVGRRRLHWASKIEINMDMNPICGGGALRAGADGPLLA